MLTEIGAEGTVEGGKTVKIQAKVDIVFFQRVVEIFYQIAVGSGGAADDIKHPVVGGVGGDHIFGAVDQSDEIITGTQLMKGIGELVGIEHPDGFVPVGEVVTGLRNVKAVIEIGGRRAGDTDVVIENTPAALTHTLCEIHMSSS